MTYRMPWLLAIGALLVLACPGCMLDHETPDAATTDAVDRPPIVDTRPDVPPECVNPDRDADLHLSIACGGDDCDDNDAMRYPGRPEICDAAGHDEDCNPLTLGPDSDGDTFPSTACCNRQPEGVLLCGTDCDDFRTSVNRSAAETCNRLDDNCNGTVDDGVCVPCAAGFTGIDGACTVLARLAARRPPRAA